MSFQWLPPEDLGFVGYVKIRDLNYPAKVKLREEMKFSDLLDEEKRKSISLTETSLKMYEVCKEHVLEVKLSYDEIQFNTLDDLLGYSQGESLFGLLVAAIVGGKQLPKKLGPSSSKE